MKKSICLLLFFFALTISVNAQTTDGIIGKWKFKDISNAEKMDSARVATLRKGFANMYIYLKENKHYTTVLFKKEEGTWQFDEASKKLTMAANKGTENQMEILSLNEKTLVLSIGKDKSFILEKVSPDASDEIEEAVYNGPLVPATTTQLCRKWYIVRKDAPDVSAETSKIATDLVKGASFEFKKDQTYSAEILGIKDEGSWQFGDGNKSIIMISGKEKKFWSIKNINDNELILVKGKSNALWAFSTKP